MSLPVNSRTKVQMNKCTRNAWPQQMLVDIHLVTADQMVWMNNCIINVWLWQLPVRGGATWFIIRIRIIRIRIRIIRIIMVSIRSWKSQNMTSCYSQYITCQTVSIYIYTLTPHHLIRLAKKLSRKHKLSVSYFCHPVTLKFNINVVNTDVKVYKP